jgi:general secretion pathway protein A
MYEEYFGFKEKPFNLAPDPDYLYLSRQHKNALSSLDFGLMDESGLMLFTGEIGTGKTTIIRHILRNIGDEFNVAVIFNTNVTSDQLLGNILQEFGLNAENDTKASAIKSLNQFLIDLRSKGKRPLLIIDEGQSLSLDALEEIRLLSNLQDGSKMLLQIMLVGQPELKAKLRTPAMDSMAQRIAVNYHLKSFNREETGQYISHRLVTAGGNPDLVSVGAVNMIHTMTGGIPRSINILCHAALVYGFADEIPIIGTQVIDEIKADTGDSGFGVDRWFEDEIEEQQSVLSYRPADTPSRPVPASTRSGHDEWEKRLETLERRVEVYTKELRDTVRVILAKERLRNDKLLMAFTQLKTKYEILQKESANHNQTVGGPPDENDTIKPLRRGKPFSIVSEQKNAKKQD